jgi:exonuclease VII small subunit
VSKAEPASAGFDALLAGLEETIARLAEGTAPLEELVTAHQKALRLLDEAQARMEVLKSGADRIARSLAE